MPLFNMDEDRYWDGGPHSFYRCRIGDRDVGFEREAMWQYIGNDPDGLIDILKLSGRVVLIGAGFGWVAERMLERGIDAVAVDTSRWIHTNKRKNAVIPILDADCMTEEGRKKIGKADWVISEDVLPTLDDKECLELCKAMRMLGKAAHWLTPGTPSYDDPNIWAGGPGLNWKTMDDWKALVAPDPVVRRGARA